MSDSTDSIELIFADYDNHDIDVFEAMERFEAYISKRERLARIEAISSLPKINPGQHYFVSGKDIDKRIAELKLNLGDK